MVHRDHPTWRSPDIAAALAANHGIAAREIDFLPLGYDLEAAAFRVRDRDGQAWFVKIRRAPLAPATSDLAVRLTAAGIPRVLAPIPALSGDVWTPLPECDGWLARFPFIVGTTAMEVGLDPRQWTAFGRTLRALHDHGHALVQPEALRGDDAGVAACDALAAMLERIDRADLPIAGSATDALLALVARERPRIDRVIADARAIGERVRARRLPRVLCHGDIHTANILVEPAGAIWLLDWDAPLLAPRERDLLFVAGGRIARRVEPDEERAFFAGYGPMGIDADHILCYRHERLIEDLAAILASVLVAADRSDATRASEVALAASFFVPGSDVDHLGDIPRLDWTG